MPRKPRSEMHVECLECGEHIAERLAIACGWTYRKVAGGIKAYICFGCREDNVPDVATFTLYFADFERRAEARIKAGWKPYFLART